MTLVPGGYRGPAEGAAEGPGPTAESLRETVGAPAEVLAGAGGPASSTSTCGSGAGGGARGCGTPGTAGDGPSGGPMLACVPAP